MPGSTYMAVVDRVLQNAGEQAIADSTNFANATGAELTKVQLQAKLFVDKVHRRIMRKLKGRFFTRKTTLSLLSSTNSYALPAGLYGEDMKPDSLFITTAAYARGPLKFMEYDKWMENFPGGETSKGTPFRWFLYPPDGTGVDHVGFSPPPIAAMTVQFEYFLVPSPLVLYSDTVAIPERSEDILWDFGQMWLEVSKSEGKAADFASILDSLFEELRQTNLGPLEKPPAINFGRMKLGGGIRGRYN